MIVPDLTNPFFTMIIKGCESVARIHGYRLTIADSENSTREESEHLELALESQASGVVMIPAGGGTPTIERALDQHFPLVFVDRTIGGMDGSSITSDNYEGAYQASKYLLRIGHNHILFLNGGADKSSAQQRLRGFMDALGESDIRISDKYIRNAEYDFEHAHRAVAQAFDDDLEFTAVFASADVMAFGAKRAIEERGLSIPDDISLVGYDDIHLASSIGLTTVAQPALEMGRNAITTLTDIIAGRLSRPTQLVLQPRLVIRETCRRVERAVTQS